MEEIPVFCSDTLTPYEKTIYCLAVSAGIRNTYSLYDEDIICIAALLNVDQSMLKKALCFYENKPLSSQIIIGDTAVDIWESSCADLFYGILKSYMIYKRLNDISDLTSDEAIIKNYHLFQECIDCFNMLISFISVFESMAQEHFSLQYSVFNSGCFSPQLVLDKIFQFLQNDDYDIFDRNSIPILCRSFEYELKTRVNTAYLILTTQIIKHSRFFSKSIKEIAEEMYEHLLGMLQNAWLVSVQAEIRCPTGSARPVHRGRNNGTTRLQLIYGYQNFDTYWIRLDLAHKGQGFVHYNNQSPGGVKSFFFNEDEYKFLACAYPDTKRFFIKHNNQYALMEPYQLQLHGEERLQFDKIAKIKEHAPAFQKNYSETDIVQFVNIIANMLPSSCLAAIDAEGEYARKCFQYSHIMTCILVLSICIFESNSKELEKLIHHIAVKAFQYQLISEDSVDEYSSYEGVYFIIQEAKTAAKAEFFS